MSRIEKFAEIARQNGVKASIREVGGSVYASVNGQTFAVRGFASFDAKCRELKGYVAPAPVELTNRLAKIEKAAIANV